MKQKIFLLLLSCCFCNQGQQRMEQNEEDLEEEISIYPDLEDDSASSISSDTRSEAPAPPPPSAAAASCEQCESLETEAGCRNSFAPEQDCFPCFRTEDWCKKCNKQYYEGKFDDLCNENSTESEGTSTKCEGCRPLNSIEQCNQSYHIGSDCFDCFTTEEWCGNCHKFYQNAIPACQSENLNYQTEDNTGYENAETAKADEISRHKQIVRDQERDLCQNCFQGSFQEDNGKCSCSKGTFDPCDEGIYHFCGINQNTCAQNLFNQKKEECGIRRQILQQALENQ